MKYIKTFEAKSFKKVNDIVNRNNFVDYIMKVYGSDGTWGEFFDRKLNQSTVEKYVDNFIKKRGKDFDGYSFDRELYRDFLFVKLGMYDINEVELNVKSFFTASELKDANALHKANKYNL